MATYTKHDLEFILKQIKISEADAPNGWNATDPLDQVDLVPGPTLPWGLRTLSGEQNNLLSGQNEFGSADNNFPHLLQQDFQDAQTFDHDRNPLTPEIATSYTQTTGTVADSTPRTISNLIVDQTITNRAAVIAALERLDYADPAAAADAYIAGGPVPEGLVVTSNGTLEILNTAPDEGLSASYNSWFTLFGQFFDHGLDLVAKGGNGTVFMPLQPDDPLYVAGSQTNFMVLTRATQTSRSPGADGLLNTADDVVTTVNTTSPFVDQNQTYSSHPSHQVFLRAYEIGTDGRPRATGELIENRDLGGDGIYGTTDDIHIGGMATWAVIKAQARDILGLQLGDHEVHNIPLLATDDYGNFYPGTNGFPQIVTTTGLVEGNPANPVATAAAIRTGHAFLDDIAHTAAPKAAVFDHDNNPNTPSVMLVDDDRNPGTPSVVFAADSDTVAGNAIPLNIPFGVALTYDNELLDAHYIAGDGRVNENIGLTAVHAIFHSEHNRMMRHTKEVVLASNDLAFLNEWLRVDVAALPANQAQIAALQWDGERLFQAAKFGTEMQYQHLVFEEFARKIQPQVDVFAGYDTAINPAIVAEFAHVVYRFGHSMLTETVDRLDTSFGLVAGTTEQIGLIEAFLNPLAYATSGANVEAATGAIVRGMTRQTGNELDEFVTEALRNNLVGLPLDLAALNIARGRDTGVPSLNAARREFFAGTGDAQLKPYVSWVDFGTSIRHAESVVNFIAAYGTHAELTATDVNTLDEKRAVATALVMGGTATINAGGVGGVERTFTADNLDRTAFLNSTGIYANLASGVTTTGVDAIDFWMGGLAERQMPFGGLLGSTFNFVFETQLEQLQDGDRLYYLARTAGLNFLSELEGNSFASLIMRNSDVTRLPGDVFSVPNFILEVDQSRQHTGLSDGGADGILGDNPLTTDVNEALDDHIGNADPTGGTIFAPLVIRDNPNTAVVETTYLRFTGGEHVVLGGTAGNDTLIASIGDDTIWGDDGDDRIEGGDGVDQLVGGAGNDIITDLGGDDNIKGGDGDDVISGGNGFDLIIAGDGSDFVIAGEDPKEVFGNAGNDFMLGSSTFDTFFGDQGDDWLDGGGQADLLQGDMGDPFQQSTVIGHDVIVGGGGNDDYDSESGDDIMVMGAGTQRAEGQLGFDWAINKNDVSGAAIDFAFTGLLPATLDNLKDRFDNVEAASGWNNNDVLRGDNFTAVQLLNPAVPGNLDTNHAINNAAQIARISGFQGFLDGMLGAGQTSFAAGNILMGGAGNDIMEGRGGNDLINGDTWLNVKIGISGYAPLTSAENMAQIAPLLMSGAISPGQLSIVREILTSSTTGVDTAVFSDIRANYLVTNNGNGTWTVEHRIPDPANAGAFLPGGADGIDTLRGIERLQFADVIQAPPGLTLTNALPTGSIVLSATTPAVNQTITVVQNTINDGEGFGPNGFRYTWQADIGGGNWQEVGTGASFTPTTDQVGLALRVVTTYTDGAGVPEQVVGTPTSLVLGVPNAAPAGLPVINGIVQEDQVLTANISGIADANGPVSPQFSYQWQRNGTNVAGATATTYTLGDADVGANMGVRVSFTDGLGNLESVTSAQTAAVVNVNDAPVVAAAAAATIAEDGLPASGTVTVTDVDNASHLYSVTTGAGNGTASINSAGGWAYAPDPDFFGTDTFTITVDDGSGALNATTTQTVTVTVTPVNDAPTLAAGGPVTINEDGQATGTAVGIDVEANPLSYSASNGTAGSVSINASGAWSYTPAANFNGTDSFTVVVSDGSAFTQQAVLVTVSSVNDQPITTAAVTVNIAEDGVANGTTTATDAADNNTTFSFSVPTTGVGSASHGLVTIDQTSGAWTYTPAANYAGPDTFTITVDDGSGVATATATQVVTVNVGAVADAPVSGGDISFSGTEDDASIIGQVPAATDADGNLLTYSVFGDTPDGVTLNADGSFSVTPSLADQGLDTTESRQVIFQYVASDGTLSSAPATVTVTINGVNDAPVAGGDASASGSEDDAVINGQVAAGTDVDVEALTYSVVGTAPAGVTFNLDGSFAVAQDLTDQGLDDTESRVVTFQYVASDGTLTSAPATVTVTINGVNDAPVAGGDASASGSEDDAVINGQVAAGSDADGEALTYSVVGTAPDGVTFNSDGSFSVAQDLTDQTLDVGESRVVTFQYVASDGTLNSAPATVTVTINGANDAPTGGVTINDDTPDLNQTLSASNTLADVDGQGTISYQWQASTDSGTTWSNIAGATNANFLTTTAQVDQQLRVTASYSDGAGPVESVSSDPTAAVGAFNIINGTTAAETLNGTGLRDQINGDDGNDLLNGLGSNDALFGAGGNDALNGGLGADAMAGGAGNDAYTLDDAGDVVTELAGEGTDTIFTSVNFDMNNAAQVENLRIMSAGGAVITGNALDNIITSGAGNDAMDGGASTTDTVSYFFATAGVTVDLSQSGAQSTGGAGVDTLTGFERILGSAFGDTLSGDAGGNRIDAGAGNDTLTGGLGADTLVGGLGDDTYNVDAGDSLSELAGQGTDQVNSAITWTLAANLENLTLTGAAAINGTGNTQNNVITGNDAVNTLTGDAGNDTLIGGGGGDALNGGLGADAMSGGAGNDTYTLDDAGDVVTELAGEGIDTILTSVNFDMNNAAQVENLRIMGAGGAVVTGNALTNIITSGAGNDSMDGGASTTDTVSYFFATTGVSVDLSQSGAQATGGAGVDTITGFERILGSAFGDTLSGDAGVNRIDAGAGNDTLTGGLGADALVGGIGDDTYNVDAGDSVTELAGQGTDQVNSAITWTLAANLENLTLTGAVAINGTGNTQNNVITGNDAVNTLTGDAGNDTLIGGGGGDALNGGLGADAMSGGAGNDTYTLDDAGDVVTELAGEGIDTIFTSVNFDMNNAAQVENLRIMSASGASVTGNALANIITSGAGNDSMDGGASTTDTVSYFFATAGVSVDLSQSGAQATGGAGVDTLAGIERILGSAFGDTLSGDAGVNRIDGGAGNDILTGGLGADTLVGGDGADTFVLTGLGDSGLGALRDIITDFVSGTDKISFAGIDANTGVAGDQAFTMIGTTAFSGGGAAGAGQLRYSVVGSNTIMEGDVDGNGIADFQLQLTGIHTFVAADLI